MKTNQNTAESYSREINEVLERLQSRSEGLSSDEARQRLSRFGPNKIREEKRISPSFYQEYKASLTMEALKNYLVEKVRVIRDGEPREIEAEWVVPGDIVELEEGEKVPAVARLLEVHALRVDESMLTGESLPVDKRIAPVETGADLGDRTDMVYAGTTVSRGTAAAVVTATGMRTELGRIAQALHETSARLQKLA